MHGRKASAVNFESIAKAAQTPSPMPDLRGRFRPDQEGEKRGGEAGAEPHMGGCQARMGEHGWQQREQAGGQYGNAAVEVSFGPSVDHQAGNPENGSRAQPRQPDHEIRVGGGGKRSAAFTVAKSNRELVSMAEIDAESGEVRPRRNCRPGQWGMLCLLPVDVVGEVLETAGTVTGLVDSQDQLSVRRDDAGAGESQEAKASGREYRWNKGSRRDSQSPMTSGFKDAEGDVSLLNCSGSGAAISR